MSATALNHIRVLDLADEAASLAGRILADLGAEVILVEPPEGAAHRRLAPFVDDQPGPDRSYHHLYYNANKHSVTLDFRTAVDVQEFRRLSDSADIIIETGTPGAMEARGLGYEQLRATNPGLICVSVSPYGQHGAKAGWKANDLTAAAAAGLLQVCGDADDPPTRGPAQPAYAMAGLAAAAGALIALHGRRAQPGGAGVHVDISLAEATMSALVQTSNPNTYLWRKEIPHRPALSQAMLCADGKWAGAHILLNRVEAFISLLNRHGVEHDLTPDNWRLMHSKRGAWTHLENPIQYTAMKLAARLPRDEFVDELNAAGSASMPVYDFPDMAHSEHYRLTNQFADTRHEPLGRVLSFSRSPVDAVQPHWSVGRAPTLGEHNASVVARARVAPAASEAPPNSARPYMPLAGIRVVDFCWVAAGPLGTRTLANFGAEVIKVESAKRMDSLRNQPLPDGSYHTDTGDLFNDANTGKKSVTIDLTREAGKDLARRLIAISDVVVDNYSAGSLERMGFRYDDLKLTNPGLVMLHLPGIGGEGEWARRRSLGPLLMAASGQNYLMGFPGRSPRGMGVAYPDFTTPFLTVSTVLACLNERERTGLGRAMELSQLAATVALFGAEWMRFGHTGVQPPRPGNRDFNYCPHGVYRTFGEDEWVAIAVRGDTEWQAMAKLIGGTPLIGDPRFRTHRQRKANEDALDMVIGFWAASRDRWQAAEQLQAVGVAASAVQDLRDVLELDDPERPHFQRVDQPSRPDWEIILDAEPIRFGAEQRLLQRAPMLGEHNEFVLREILGLSDEEVAQLIVDGVVQ
jgi:crotonobetainyl-CoA:carnitine CoA-transferase CaiB-like acyl-CoA transferase